jgi:hypothetical protein
MIYKNTTCRNRPPVRYPESKEILHQLSGQPAAFLEIVSPEGVQAIFGATDPQAA